MRTHARSSHRRARQHGVVLFVALIVLVALAMAALALLRSTDVASLVAGNLAFKRSALNSTDLGVKAAYAYVVGLGNDTTSPAGGCYSAAQVDSDASGLPTLLADPVAFVKTHPACQATGGIAGEKIYFYTERLCALADVPAYAGQCGAAHVVQSGVDAAHALLTVVQPVYRTTVRVDGLRSTNSVSQVIWRR
jgi:type IV pilus assembly protein PilX